MEREHLILNYIQNEEQTTQRQIAGETGLSLGSVNLLLKRMIKKGLIKIERLNARTIRYILTPYGLAEKSKLTYRYIKHSYAQITRLASAVENLLEKIQVGKDEVIYLYGPQNEVFEVLNLVLGKGKINHVYITDDRRLPDPSTQIVIIVWDLSDEEKLAPSYRAVNLLKELR